MAGISITVKDELIERSLDGLDALRDSIEKGMEIAVSMRELGEVQQDQQILAYADIVRAFSFYFENKLEDSVLEFEKLIHIFVKLQDQHGVFFAKTGLVVVLRSSVKLSKLVRFVKMN